ncbi:MAG: DUF3800 domain-containing protein [Elusimicrobiota bacterium]
MAHILFIDESGHDRSNGGYEVLAGISIEDKNLWDWIQSLQELEENYFGTKYRTSGREIKGKKLLKTKTFKMSLKKKFKDLNIVKELASECLLYPDSVTNEKLAALSWAKIYFSEKLFEICEEYGCRAFASIVNPQSKVPEDKNFLRKDYTYLFERFYYYLEDMDSYGLIVFDELQKSQSHIILSQMSNYFIKTSKGIKRSKRIIPEPFFVHSDLTSGIQVADMIAYVISWAWKGKNKSLRPELSSFFDKIGRLRYKRREEPKWSFKYIDDLMPSR